MTDFSISITHLPAGGTPTTTTIEVNGAGQGHSQSYFEPAPASLEWSDTLCNGERVDYADAEKACAALGEGWRLPTRQELDSIVDLTRHDPAIDTDRFPGTKSGAYWSSTPCAWSSDRAWVVSFYHGNSYDFHRDGSSAFVRAVRSVPAGQ